jgi:DNA-binding FadR family transcriptional regulator
MAIDRLFHVRIAAATRNTVLEAIVDQLWEQTTAPIYSGLRRRTDRPEHHRAALMHHERVLEALRHRDGTAGCEAMRAHLAQTEATLMEVDIAADAEEHLADGGH